MLLRTQKDIEVCGEPSQKLKGWAVKEENVPRLEAFMEIVKKAEKNMESENLVPRPTIMAYGLSPNTVCVYCQNAVWHILKEKNRKISLRVFCQVMHALIDGNIKACDGLMVSQDEESEENEEA